MLQTAPRLKATWRSRSPSAVLALSRSIATCERLALFPMRGVPREDIRPGLRVTHHRGRTIIAYGVDASAREVAVLGVFHGGQDYGVVLAAET